MFSGKLRERQMSSCCLRRAQGSRGRIHDWCWLLFLFFSLLWQLTSASTNSDGGGEQDCDYDDDSGGDRDSIEAILALSDRKCKKKENDVCDLEDVPGRVLLCLTQLQHRTKALEGRALSNEQGTDYESSVTSLLIRKRLLDCHNDSECDDDHACMKTAARSVCHDPCRGLRSPCVAANTKCVTVAHKNVCVCKEGFAGNASHGCIPEGFLQRSNGRSYRSFFDRYVDFGDAADLCHEFGARLPVLDTLDTLSAVLDFLSTGNFSVFEHLERSSRRVWLGLERPRGGGRGLVWLDGGRVEQYPASANLFVWETRRILSEEARYAPVGDVRRHFALYVDGDVAKLPGGGRRGAAVLCELLEQGAPEPEHRGAGGGGSGDRSLGPRSDGGYPDYPPPDYYARH